MPGLARGSRATPGSRRRREARAGGCRPFRANWRPGADNIFREPIGRFATIDKDVAPMHLLVSDYRDFLG